MATQNPHNPPLLGSVYNGYVPQVDPNNPNKVIKKFGMFEFSEDVNTTPWHVPSLLHLAPSTAPLLKFKDYLPKFLDIGTCTVEEHLNGFSNCYNNIGSNSNHVCMRLLVNTLKAKETTDFFNFPPKSSSNWAILCYWFKSS